MSERTDAIWMRRALTLARQGEGAVSPNPMVGAVVVRNGRCVGEGYHRIYGAAHAEAAALEAAGRRSRRATLYTNLEPCAHSGKTPPCTEAIRAAGIRRVVGAMLDPHPRVRGRGFRSLRQGGIHVSTGVLAREAELLNRTFLRSLETGRPYVILKAGMSLDGRIAGSSGQSRWITSARARRRAHRLRASVDAVLVGVTTARRDDPLLTARPGKRSLSGQPLRIVMDSHYRLSPRARLFKVPRGGPVLVYGAYRNARMRRLLEEAGADVRTLPRRRGRLDLGMLLDDLGSQGVGSILVEGGGEVAWSFLRRGYADRIAWFVAPCLLGGGAVPVLGGPGVTGPQQAIRIHDLVVSKMGDELLIQGTPALP
ncbi:MAG: bifunctional diaminohydroxyphosphoribosylaminopyrimidine deaminase/5-amino-6-(5-phosphoribosylamino)uracil reductase RibD [Acidobacteriota bacterium]